MPHLELCVLGSLCSKVGCRQNGISRLAYEIYRKRSKNQLHISRTDWCWNRSPKCRVLTSFSSISTDSPFSLICVAWHHSFRQQVFSQKRYTSSRSPNDVPDTDNSKTQKRDIGLERAGLPIEVGRVAGFLASGFSSYVTGANIVVDGGTR